MGIPLARPSRLLLRCCLLWSLAGTALAVTLSSQSSVGISSEFASNPFYLGSGARSAEALGFFANLPATYTSDTQMIDLIPRLRFAEPFGPVSLLSNYEYLDADWHWKSERNTFTATGELHHDSTYYNDFEQAALLGHDLLRLEQNATLAWDRALSERSDLQLTGSWDKVTYTQSVASAVSNFRYAQGALQYNHALSELWQWTSSIGYGQFKLLNGSYLSDQRFAQTAVSRTLSERWSLTAQVGYAYLSAHGLGYSEQLEISPNGTPYLALIPVEQYAARGSPNFSVSAEHKGERLVVDAAASRAIQPSGFGVLLTEDNASLSANLAWTERWTLSAGLRWARLSDSLGRLNLDDRHSYGANVSASWQWTEHWTLQVQGSYAEQYLAPQIPPVPGVTVYLNLVRQFGQLRL